MKKNISYIIFIISVSFLFVLSCSEDNTNYDYIELAEFKVDTLGFKSEYIISQGDSLKISPTIEYSEPDENLRFYWLSIPAYYQQVQDGNTLVYPPADTLSTEKNLDITVSLKPAGYSCTYVVEDLNNNRKTFKDFYLEVERTLVSSSLYLLEDVEGGTDVSIVRPPRTLSSEILLYQYYSSVNGQPLEGNPLFINSVRDFTYPHDYFYVFTDQNAVRLSGEDFFLMDEFDDMFYNPPANYNPQGVYYVGDFNVQYLINDGKLHTLYHDQANDRKFSAPVSGDYELSPYISLDPFFPWGPDGQMEYTGYFYDQLNQKYLPLQRYASQYSQFSEVAVGAPFDVNNIGKELVYAEDGFNKYFFSIFEDGDGSRSLYLPKFNEAIDDGNLAEEEGIYDLSGADNIQDAKYFGVCGAGPVMAYATDKAIYTFNYQGNGESNLIYEFPSNLNITTMLLWRPGGHPMDSRVIWVGAYDESTGEGFLYEFEIGPASGELEPNIFGNDWENPFIIEGFGKIVDIHYKS